MKKYITYSISYIKLKFYDKINCASKFRIKSPFKITHTPSDWPKLAQGHRPTNHIHPYKVKLNSKREHSPSLSKYPKMKNVVDLDVYVGCSTCLKKAPARVTASPSHKSAIARLAADCLVPISLLWKR